MLTVQSFKPQGLLFDKRSFFLNSLLAPRFSLLGPHPSFMPSLKHSLKQHFIPHEGNNYHPHALHTKRTVLYGGLLIAIKVFVVAFAVVLPTEAFLAPDVLSAQTQRIIALTNQLRNEQGLPLLDTNGLLTTSAGLKAEDMNAKQYFSHTSPEGHKLSYFLGKAGYKYSTAGENLAVGFSDASDVVDAWMKSPKHYSNLVDTDFKQFGLGLVAGEFEGKPTVFVAQHFGSPSAVAVKPVEKAVVPVQGTEKPPVVAEQAPVAVPSKPVETVKPVEVKPAPVQAKPVEPIVTIEQVIPDPTTEVELVRESTSTPIVEQNSTSTESVNGMFAENATSSESVLGTIIPDKNQMDASQSFVAWKDEGKKSTNIFAQVFISGPVKSASVSVAGYTIPLQKEGDGLYHGNLTASISSKELFKVVISPTIDIVWADNTALQDTIAWKDPKIASQTPWERYIQANSWLSASIPVFPVVRAIYWFALIFFSIALALSIFIQIKKQHPHIIAQTIGLLGVISLMLWK